VHYWADLQSVHGFRCYDNSAEREIPASACTRPIPVIGNGADINQPDVNGETCLMLSVKNAKRCQLLIEQDTFM